MYLIGTAHVSKQVRWVFIGHVDLCSWNNFPPPACLTAPQAAEDTAHLIRRVSPAVVVLELDAQRAKSMLAQSVMGDQYGIGKLRGKSTWDVSLAASVAVSASHQGRPARTAQCDRPPLPLRCRSWACAWMARWFPTCSVQVRCVGHRVQACLLRLLHAAVLPAGLPLPPTTATACPPSPSHQAHTRSPPPPPCVVYVVMGAVMGATPGGEFLEAIEAARLMGAQVCVFVWSGGRYVLAMTVGLQVSPPDPPVLPSAAGRAGRPRPGHHHAAPAVLHAAPSPP